VTLPLEVARDDASLALVDDPDMSLKRFVVPRVAPMLELPELVEVLVSGVEMLELDGLAGVEEPELE
jgi:hypothetical protein